MKLYLAPLRGITDEVFRTVYESYFGTFDRIMAPFIPTYKGTAIKQHHLKDIWGLQNDRSRIIPQIIGNDPEAFLTLATAMANIGYPEINWNLGCPIPLIARKTRGSGLLANPEIIESFLEKVVPAMPCKLSVKVRLGYDNPDELERLIPLFNRYPLSEIIIHPRTGIQLYEGMADRSAFYRLAPMIRHKIIYNGDIREYNDITAIESNCNFVCGFMVGRGILMNPSLLINLQHKIDISAPDFSRIYKFILTLQMRNREFLPPLIVLGKMKELWSYLATIFPEKDRYLKAILQSETIETYNSIINEWFDSLNL